MDVLGDTTLMASAQKLNSMVIGKAGYHLKEDGYCRPKIIKIGGLLYSKEIPKDVKNVYEQTSSSTHTILFLLKKVRI